MHLIYQAKEYATRGLLAIVLGLAAGGCVRSSDPVLSDGKAILGPAWELHLYDLQEGTARNRRTFRIQWDGRSYAVRDPRAEIREFTIHAYEGRDLIVQMRGRQPLRPYFYALARKLTDGVYRLVAIDPEDADEAARNRFCIKTRDAPCRIEAPEQLFVFARATASKEGEGGMLAVLVRAGRR